MDNNNYTVLEYSDNMNLESKWHPIAIQHFPKIRKKRFTSIITNILAVDLQLKPCYLWDAFTAVPSAVNSFIEDLKFHKLIRTDIRVASINDDVLVLSLTTCSSHLEQQKHVINVSSHLKVPELASQDVVERVNKHKLQLLVELTQTSTGYIKVNADPDWNISALFGAVINYPVIYWYEKDSDNCLSMIPLRVYTVNAKLCNRDQTLYSFSIPEIFSQQLDSAVKDWFQNTAKVCLTQNVFTNLNLRQSVETLSSVIM
ncbi:hypothetical protein CHUAL_008818 [Chamberlinius hualienensis]